MLYFLQTALDSLSSILGRSPLLQAAVLPPLSVAPPAKRQKKVARGRFLLPVEWQRIRPVLDAHPMPKARWYFYVLILTGARRTEAQLMEWRHLDLSAGFWHKPMTKNGRAPTLPLSPHLCQILDGLPRLGRYVFPGEKRDTPWSHTAIEHAWRRIRTAAEVEDVRIHDLRRTVGSWMTMRRENIRTVQKIMDHAFVTTTQIYSQVDQETIRAAMTRHADCVMGLDKAPAIG